MLIRLRELLFPPAPGVAVVAVHADGGVARVEARCTLTGAARPGCSHWTERVHSSYLRFPADLPTTGRRAQLALRGRRFFCTATACGRRTFVEQVPGLTRRHSRVTERLRQTTGAIGPALAGQAGARLAQFSRPRRPLRPGPARDRRRERGTSAPPRVPHMSHQARPEQHSPAGRRRMTDQARARGPSEPLRRPLPFTAGTGASRPELRLQAPESDICTPSERRASK